MSVLSKSFYLLHSTFLSPTSPMSQLTSGCSPTYLQHFRPANHPSSIQDPSLRSAPPDEIAEPSAIRKSRGPRRFPGPASHPAQTAGASIVHFWKRKNGKASNRDKSPRASVSMPCNESSSATKQRPPAAFLQRPVHFYAIILTIRVSWDRQDRPRCGRNRKSSARAKAPRRLWWSGNGRKVLSVVVMEGMKGLLVSGGRFVPFLLDGVW